MNKETGGPAFPMAKVTVLAEDGTPIECGSVTHDGMTLRDYLAVHASDQDVSHQGEILREIALAQHGIAGLEDNWRSTARYMHADAMLAERLK